MSASIRGGLSFTSMPSSPPSQRKRRPTVSGLSYSAPNVPQLTLAEKGQEKRDQKHYPPPPTPGLGPSIYGPTGMLAGHPSPNSPIPNGGGGPQNAPLMPMTPIAAPSSSSAATPPPPPSSDSASGSSVAPSASASQAASNVGAPLSTTPSRVSIASTSSSQSGLTTHTHHTSGGVSRASSVRSTSSVQAVPMRKPQRGIPGGAGAAGRGGRNVPKIMTRGLNALGAYGVGVGSPTRTGGGPGEADVKGKGRVEEGGAGLGPDGGSSRPGLAGWRGRWSSSSSIGGGKDAASSGGAYLQPAQTGSGAMNASAGYGAGDSLPSPVSEGQSSDGLNSPGRGGFPSRGRWESPQRALERRERELSTKSSRSDSTAGPSSPLGTMPPASPLIHSSSYLQSLVGVRGDSPARPSLSQTRQREDSVGGNSIANSLGVVGNRRSTEDFEFGEVLGEGSYSTVTHVTTTHPPHRHYALKVLDKEHIKREKKTKYVLIERDTLKALDGHPGVIKLWWTFQDEWSLYYVLELAENGELLKWIKQYGSFDLPSARYYTAQILDAVKFMHEKGVIHRDLKPENILLTTSMRMKITDFGTAKLLKKEELIDGRPADQADSQGRPRARSFVGTPEYVSPEVLSEGKESSFSSDFWALGCVLFQLLAGRPPFQARTEYLMFQKIINLEYEFPLGFPAVAKDLVENLLVLDPAARLGGDPKNGNGIEAIMRHPFFSEAIPPDLLYGEQEGSEKLPVAEEQDASTPESTAPSSLEVGEDRSLATATSTPASSLNAPSQALVSKADVVDTDVTEATSRLSIASPVPSPSSAPTAATTSPLSSSSATSVSPRGPSSPSLPASSTPPQSPSLSSTDPVHGPIDFSTIWTVDPPDIKTGLVQPAPVVRGEFVLLDDGAGSSLAPSTNGTGLTRATYRSRVGEDGEGDGEWADDRAERGSVSDEYDVDETASSPTSASGRDLPPASTFGVGKWSNVLLPSEAILMLSQVLQRPASSAAAARTAILRGPTKLKFPGLNPLNLISSSPSSSVGSSSTATSLTATATSGSSSSAPTMSSLSNSPSPSSPPALAPPPPKPGAKPRTLILTDYPRLLCIKESPQKITVKSEVFLGSALRGGVRREGVSAFIHVEQAGKEGRGFVVKTSSRNYKYDEPSGQAERWIAELKEAHRAGLMGPQGR
ncbi:hypothetical protein JCM11641_006050 [Rhodosporidiobolus odoratus]